MLPGPGVDQLAKPSSVGVRVSSVLAGQTLALDIPCADVVVDGTSNRTVPHQLQFDVPLSWMPTHDRSPLANKGQRLHVWSTLSVGGRPFSFDRGWFQIEHWEQSGDVVQVTALDLMRTLETDPMSWPSSPPRGATLKSELQRLAGGMPVHFEATDKPISTATQWDRDRVKSIKDLCEAHGLEYGVKPDGYLHVWAHRTGGDKAATYAAKNLLLDASRASGERRPNRWLAVGSKTEGSGDDAKEIRWAYEAKADYPPYGSEYGIVREIMEISSAESPAQVTQAANRAFSDSLIVSEKRPLEIVLDPRVELGDVIGVVPDEGSPFVGRVEAFSMPLSDPSARMRVDVGVLSW